jgi:hypothetical protein
VDRVTARGCCFVWVTTSAPKDRDCNTLHAAGCAHLRRIPAEAQVPLDACEIAAAMREAARDEMDSDSMYAVPEDVITPAPCALKRAAR